MKKNGKTLPIKELDNVIREAVAEAIRQEHLQVSAVAKTVGSVTGISNNVIAKWQKQKSTPSAAHLLRFAAHYPSGLQMVLTLMERHDLWQFAVENNVPEMMREQLRKRTGQYRKCGDILPEIEVQKDASPLNERQLWFLEMLKTGKKMQNRHIAAHWSVALRTAKRDTEKLLAAGRIECVRKGRMAWFEIMEGQDE